MRDHSSVVPGVLADYCDGKEFSSHTLFGVNSVPSLQILLYYDDVEVCNPLGSSRVKHKLGTMKVVIQSPFVKYLIFVTGMFYFSVGNIRPRFRSKIKTIQLLAVCKQKLIKKYSMNAVLRPLVKDIKKLVSTLILNRAHTLFLGGRVCF